MLSYGILSRRKHPLTGHLEMLEHGKARHAMFQYFVQASHRPDPVQCSARPTATGMAELTSATRGI